MTWGTLWLHLCSLSMLSPLCTVALSLSGLLVPVGSSQRGKDSKISSFLLPARSAAGSPRWDRGSRQSTVLLIPALSVGGGAARPTPHLFSFHTQHLLLRQGPRPVGLGFLTPLRHRDSERWCTSCAQVTVSSFSL